ncbi:hypothetical protein D9611_015129 [Ephemerocybe angulata]|uniref:Uncharacterized protein n=1 Tax=Ephemerocybe angulata TaxID=980116 RepID=A0A8H5F8V2_9AGAR|nr:hypothetical protein D9611_015129 [Tulosesus angulatus]
MHGAPVPLFDCKIYITRHPKRPPLPSLIATPGTAPKTPARSQTHSADVQHRPIYENHITICRPATKSSRCSQTHRQPNSPRTALHDGHSTNERGHCYSRLNHAAPTSQHLANSACRSRLRQHPRAISSPVAISTKNWPSDDGKPSVESTVEIEGFVTSDICVLNGSYGRSRRSRKPCSTYDQRQSLLGRNDDTERRPVTTITLAHFPPPKYDIRSTKERGQTH